MQPDVAQIAALNREVHRRRAQLRAVRARALMFGAAARVEDDRLAVVTRLLDEAREEARYHHDQLLQAADWADQIAEDQADPDQVDPDQADPDQAGPECIDLVSDSEDEEPPA